MEIRRNVLPRRPVDWFCFLLIGVFMPIVFMFEMIIVLPAFHTPGGFFHTFTFLLAMFLVFNIKGNMIACLMIDTSCSAEPKCAEPPEDAVEAHGWWHCDACERLMPPRSWHCKVCRTCILKRDHHCLFTGCCIGHKNHRYFMFFIFYLFIGATYALVYNSLFLWVIHARTYNNWLSLLKMICPMLMLVTGTTWQNMFLIFYNLNILAFAYSIVLLIYHVPSMLHGGVSYERGKQTNYNLGSHGNLRAVFGQRMHLVWLSPLIKSELPHCGILWKTNPKIKQTNRKLLKDRKQRNTNS